MILGIQINWFFCSKHFKCITLGYNLNWNLNSPELIRCCPIVWLYSVWNSHNLVLPIVPPLHTVWNDDLPSILQNYKHIFLRNQETMYNSKIIIYGNKNRFLRMCDYCRYPCCFFSVFYPSFLAPPPPSLPPFLFFLRSSYISLYSKRNVKTCNKKYMYMMK